MKGERIDSPMVGVWYESAKFLPDVKMGRVLCFSPQYKDESMRIRIMDSQFLGRCTDVLWWSVPKLPEY